MLAQQLAGARIEESHAVLIPLHFDATADPAGRGSVVGGFDLDAAIQVHDTLAELIETEGLQRQFEQRRFFLGEHRRHLALGGAVDARVGPARLPAVEVSLGVGEALQALAFERCVLGVADAAFDFAFGEKRALQTVTTVARKFLPSRIRFIRCEDGALNSFWCATTGAGTESRTWAQRGVCAHCQSSGQTSIRPIRWSLWVRVAPFSALISCASCAG